MKARSNVRLTLTFLMAFTLLSATVGDSQTVVRRARLGNNTEDITFVTKGPLAKHIVIIDGAEVWAFPAQGKGKAKPRKLFDLLGLDLQMEPRGIAHVGSEKLFALIDPSMRSTLFMVDHKGRSAGNRAIEYLGDYMPEYLEGLAWLPQESPFYPDHLVLVAMGGEPYTRLEIIRRDGVVVDEIIVDDELQWAYLGAVCFVAPDRLLVSDYERIYFLGFDGEITGGPYPDLEGFPIEGAVQLANGNIAAAGYWEGTLFMLDEYLNRLPEQDRDYSIGIGLKRPRGLAWDSVGDEFLTIHVVGDPQTVQAIAPSLDSSRQVADPSADGFDWVIDVAFLPDEELIALTHRAGERAILLYDRSGTLVEVIDLGWLGRPSTIEYATSTDEFLVRLREPGLETMVYVLDRAGNPVREFDLAPAGVTGVGRMGFFAPDHPSGGKLMVVADYHRVVVTDLNGNWVGEFNHKIDLGTLDWGGATAITSGPYAGAFAMMASDSSELVIFTLP